jgi:hypothetical protein
VATGTTVACGIEKNGRIAQYGRFNENEKRNQRARPSLAADSLILTPIIIFWCVEIHIF